MSQLYLKYRESRTPFLFHAILCLLAYIIWVMIVMFALPFFLIIQVYNIIYYILTRILIKGRTIHLADKPFLLGHDSNPYVIVGFIKLNGQITCEEFSELFQKRIFGTESVLETVAKLKQYPPYSYSNFVVNVETNFQLEDHIVQYRETIEGVKEELEDIFSTMAVEKLPVLKSPWKMVICNTKAGRETYLFFSFHHFIGDGFSLQKFFSQLLDAEPRYISLKKEHGVMSDLPIRIIKGIINTPLALTTLILSRYINNPFYLNRDFRGKSRCVAWSNKIPFHIVHNIKCVTKTTINDVLLSALTGAIRKYLNNTKLLAEIPIVITFNSRSREDMLKSTETLSNKSGGNFISLPIYENDSMKCLNLINYRTKILKNSSDGHLFEFIFSKIIGLLPYSIANLAANSLQQHCSLLVTNMPGPIDNMYINKLKIEDFVSSPPLMYNLGVAISFYSYSNYITMTTLSIKSVLPDPNKLVKYFEEEIYFLNDQICRQSSDTTTST